MAWGELAVDAWRLLLWVVIPAAVGVACFRRSRHLSGRPVPTSLLIAVAAALVPLLWLVVWVVNKDRTDREWQRHRLERATVAPG
ncbi:hypothetical protein [Aeromicrobium sp. IC_218]|uniref:hypothetical protein n=1 Tax=Aeromicrobium sp. IC_218 TaxID=2545468 RepID=UPI001039AC4F|nr:hypothetical protein [Aeromicrobium sp. IC_218]TCI98648.1 hypothetical protein E0W78_09750 [Aeromicrobium sp. IC_218]